jgi:hypothetical protein
MTGVTERLMILRIPKPCFVLLSWLDVVDVSRDDRSIRPAADHAQRMPSKIALRVFLPPIGIGRGVRFSSLSMPFLVVVRAIAFLDELIASRLKARP